MGLNITHICLMNRHRHLLYHTSQTIA